MRLDDLTESEITILIAAHWAKDGRCPEEVGDLSRLVFRHMAGLTSDGGCFILPVGLEVLSKKFPGLIPRSPA